jgi:dolichyl-phosphate beta-glucosyltransferase
VELSLIIPAYNSALFIEDRLLVAYTYLIEQQYDFEIVVVNDGSTDNTNSILFRICAQYENIKMISLPKNFGKFYAIKAGVAIARGSCILFTDADVPFRLSSLSNIERLVNGRAIHIVIGDRSLYGSVYTSELTILRRGATKFFSYLVKLFVADGLFDTQCGLKGFRRDIALTIFPLLKTDGFAGDVELLYLALRCNLEIKRIPVQLEYAAPSSVSCFVHSITMIWNILKINFHWMRGRYECSKLKDLSQK